jgi:arylsulfatase A-like enzyme
MKYARCLRPLVLLLLACVADTTRAAAPTERPNVVVLLADDQGWGDLSINGNTNLATPRIDSLASDGAMLDRFYVSPVCSPTRAEFLTGRYYPRGGVYGTMARAERLNLDERTIAETFRAAGYATGAFGKWHNGSQGPYHPNARGFDEFYGITSGHHAHYLDAPMDHNGRTVRGRGFIVDDLTDRALAFIEQQRRRPFFVYLPFNTPHSPMQVPDRFYAKFARAELTLRDREPEQEDLAHTRAALAMVENIDWNVGRLLDRLEQLGLARNTVVLYFSDNGPNGRRWNGDMKGRKGAVDEGGVRAPFLIRWPGRIRAGLRVPQIAAAIDLLPTLADLAGIPLIGTKPLDGQSIAPLLLGTTTAWPDRRLFSFRIQGQVSVRTQQYRLDPAGALFDLAADPGQYTNIAAQHPALVAELRAAAAAMKREVIDARGPDDRPLPVGWGTVTILPAGDATVAGAVKPSNRFNNASYFTAWSETSGVVTWEVELMQAGDYEAVIEYACPAADVGATLELAFAGRTLAAKVTAAHDPPLLGAAEDRVPRVESYTKDWKPLSLGTLHLAQGRGPLTLRATAIPGRQAAEVASLTLVRR